MRLKLINWTYLGFAALTLFLPLRALATTDLCSAFQNTVPLPDWYRGVCDRASAGLAKLGGAFSTFADSFNLNPASIPTAPTPYGVEYIGSFTPGTPTAMRHNFAFIKGYQRVGAGLSTNSDDTFYSNSQRQNFQGTSYGDLLEAFVPDSVAPTFNVGSAVALLPERVSKEVSANLGVTLKYNKYLGQVSPGGGLSLETPSFTFGASVIRESETQYAISTSYYTFTAGYKHRYFQVEYIHLKNTTSYGLVSDPIQILTMSAHYKALQGTAALRRLTNYEAVEVIQPHFAVQYQFSGHFSAAYLLNYIPGTQSIGLQVFL